MQHSQTRCGRFYQHQDQSILLQGNIFFYRITRYNASASPRFPDYEARIAEQQQTAITALLNEKEDTILQKLK
jgi:hypothetical protein